MMRRRDFIKKASSAILVLSSGDIFHVADISGISPKKAILRFAVASDGHYGQKDTDFDGYFREITDHINKAHGKKPFDFCVVNGDIIHDDKSVVTGARAHLDTLRMKYYVTQGNHDHLTATEWEAAWNMPVNLDFSVGRSSVLLGTTSDEKGTYLCPKLEWFREKLEQHKSQEQVFIFVHINPAKQTRHAVDCPDFLDLLGRYKNVKAVFNGHDHDEDGIKTKAGIPFIFDSHFGGNWGTGYRGFRVVELRKDKSLLTYILNPAEKINEATL